MGDDGKNKKLYVGNLPYDVDNDELEDVFRVYGGVLKADVICDRASGRSKGFGFVEMETRADAEKALAMNGRSIAGRNVNVHWARPKQGR